MKELKNKIGNILPSKHKYSSNPDEGKLPKYKSEQLTAILFCLSGFLTGLSATFGVGGDWLE